MGKLKAIGAFLFKWYPYVVRAVNALKNEFKKENKDA